MIQAPEDAILASWAANAAPWIALLQGSGIASRQTTNPAIINAISRPGTAPRRHLPVQ